MEELQSDSGCQVKYTRNWRDGQNYQTFTDISANIAFKLKQIKGYCTIKYTVCKFVAEIIQSKSPVDSSNEPVRQWFHHKFKKKSLLFNNSVILYKFFF